MPNSLNEWFKRNPAEGGVFILLLLVAGTTLWVKVLEPSRSVGVILTDAGFWFGIALLGVPMFLLYYVTAKRVHH